jgi:ABC-type Na+ efflux pump permease subunit
MRSFWNEYKLIFKHELVASFRDWRALMYTLAVPLLVMAFGFMGAIGRQYEDLRKPRLAIESANVSNECLLLIEELKHSSKFLVLQGAEPLTQLREHEVDAVISFPARNTTIELTLRATTNGEEQAARLRKQIATIRDRVFDKISEQTKSSVHFTYAIEANVTDEKSSSTSLVQIAMILVGLMFCRLGFSMSYSARTVWLDEVGAGKLETLLVLPISRFTLAAAKSAVMITLGFIRIMLDGVAFSVMSIFIAIAFILTSGTTLNSEQTSKAPILNGHLPWGVFFAMTAVDLVAFSLLCASIILITVCSVKRKHAGLVLTFILTFITIPPLVAFFPDVQLNLLTTYAPVFNMTLTLRQLLLGSAQPILLVMSVLEVLLIAAVLTFISVKLMERERFLLKDSTET